MLFLTFNSTTLLLMKRISMILAAMIIAGITFGSLAATAQIRQTTLYIDDGNGNFSLLTGARGGGHYYFPVGGGTVLTSSSNDTITSGLWLGSSIGVQYGGTGLGSYNTGDILYASSPTTLQALPIGASNDVLTVVGGVPAWQPASSGGNGVSGTYADVESSAVSPSAINTSTPVLAGANITITPSATGKVLVTITGSISGAASTSAYVQIYYGTGNPPDHDAGVPSGSHAVGSIETVGNSSTAPFSCTAVVTGLAVGTSYWLDAGYYGSNSGNGHAVSISGVTISAVELP